MMSGYAVSVVVAGCVVGCLMVWLASAARACNCSECLRIAGQADGQINHPLTALVYQALVPRIQWPLIIESVEHLPGDPCPAHLNIYDTLTHNTIINILTEAWGAHQAIGGTTIMLQDLFECLDAVNNNRDYHPIYINLADPSSLQQLDDWLTAHGVRLRGRTT